jgi:hypothetical protein
MKTSTELSNKFYQHLGKLFYAVAASDKQVRQEESNRLKQLIRTDWLQLDDATDEFGTDSAHQIEIIFDWLSENKRDPLKCMEEFSAFKKTHESLFPDEVKKLIHRTAYAIAGSFSGKNKSELVLLSQLEKLLT